MDPRTESRLLRLAIARGLLRWEDLDAVPASAAKNPASPTSPAGIGPDALGEGRWVPGLIAAGRLSADVVSELLAIAESDRSDVTLDLSAGLPAPTDPWPSWRDFRSTRLFTRLAGDPDPADEPTLPTSSAVFAPEHRFLAGWDRYRVEGFVGAGGMGSVYRAFDPRLGRTVALKFLHRNDAAQTGRFLAEARAQARVDHPSVCRVYEVGEVEGRPYIAMQFIAGASLGESAAKLSLERRIELLRDTARAIHAAHRTGLIHRDLKPGNILVGTDEDEGSGALHPYVVDFGLARGEDEAGLTRTGLISGTPAYLSPEQAQGRPLDRRSDVYSLGVVLYELLAGSTPFAGSNAAETLLRLVQEEPRTVRKVAPQVPRDLETIAMKCLERDPGRRYDSALAVADDLDRYLEGEPIRARPAGLAYRAGKRLRKQRALAVVAGAAVLAVAVLGIAVVRARVQSRERAVLAQRFGQRVEDLESRLRSAALLPLHDVTPQKQEIRRELALIQGEMARLGPVAEGPGHYALGRAYLALHQSERAREHLDRAWRAGERTPDVAAALGQAVGLLYEKTLADADRSRAGTGPALREDVEKTYRRPALSYLREGLAAGGRRSPYLAALVDYYEGRYSRALHRAQEAYRQEPLFYEAGELAAEILAAQADELAEAGRYQDALRRYDEAGEAYGRLLAAVRSDASLYAADCALRARRIEVEILAGGSWEEQVAPALGVCDLGLAVDRDLGAALDQKARILWRRGDQHNRRGEDPRVDLQAAVALATRAIQLDSSDALARKNLALAQRLHAEWALARGLDPWPWLRPAVAAARELVRVQPELAASHTTLGLAFLAVARARQGSGGDPGPAARAAAASCRRAVTLSPRSVAGWVNLGNAWKILAEREVAHGRDPSLHVAGEVEALAVVVRLNPNYAAAWNNLGNAHQTLGEYRLASGADPRSELEQAAVDYRHAIALKHVYGAFNLGATQRGLALAALERGEDPGVAVAAAERSLDDSLRANATDPDAYLEQGRVRTIAARWALAHGGDPQPDLGRAADALTRAQALNPRQPEIYLENARIARYRGAWQLQHGRREPAARAAAAGLRELDRALAIAPGEARCRAERGLLLDLSAQLETAAARRARLESEAAATLAGALRDNPLLEREYGPALRAARLAAAPLL